MLHKLRSCKRIVSNFSFRHIYSNNGFRPRRSLLYVPGIEPRKIKKATLLRADVVVLDMEDGVAQSMKRECRETVVELLPELQFNSSESAVRINSADSMYAEEDVSALMNGRMLPEAIMFPKIENEDHICWLKSRISNFLDEKSRNALSKKIRVIGQCETAVGMMNLMGILSEALKDDRHLKFEAFVFGSDDYLASIGATRTREATELLFARQYFVMHVKGFGLHAIDMVDIDFNDLEGLRMHSEAGAKMGFTGKQVIHPKQIDVVNKCFSPSEYQVDLAQRLIKAFEQHQGDGKGAFSFEGKMIDMPSVKQAQNIVRLAGVV